MARFARLVIPGLSHHVTQRGNRRQQTFFGDEDDSAYVKLMGLWCTQRGVAIWAYCRMPNHIHLIVGSPLRFLGALGSATFVERLERTVGRRLRFGKPGRPSRLLKRP